MGVAGNIDQLSRLPCGSVHILNDCVTVSFDNSKVPEERSWSSNERIVGICSMTDERRFQ